MPPTRREFIRFIGASATAAALPIGCGGDDAGDAPAKTGFLTDVEKSALAAIADGILPPDDQPGGKQLGTVDYTERLLTIFEGAAGSRPPLFVGGPFSGRQPFADANGTPSTRFPPNDFVKYAELDRVTEHAWRLALYGSDGVAGGGPNDAVTGKIVGLRQQVRDAIARAQSFSKTPLGQLGAAGIDEVIHNLDIDARDLFFSLVVEAAFASPEYGGNPGAIGWKMVHFEGDSQPLGYSQYDEGAKTYRERADAPMSTANASDPEPLDAEVHAFVAKIVDVLGGKVAP